MSRFTAVEVIYSSGREDTYGTESEGCGVGTNEKALDEITQILNGKWPKAAGHPFASGKATLSYMKSGARRDDAKKSLMRSWIDKRRRRGPVLQGDTLCR